MLYIDAADRNAPAPPCSKLVALSFKLEFQRSSFLFLKNVTQHVVDHDVSHVIHLELKVVANRSEELKPLFAGCKHLSDEVYLADMASVHHAVSDNLHVMITVQGQYFMGNVLQAINQWREWEINFLENTSGMTTQTNLFLQSKKYVRKPGRKGHLRKDKICLESILLIPDGILTRTGNLTQVETTNGDLA